jgi:hypothetical protein
MISDDARCGSADTRVRGRRAPPTHSDFSANSQRSHGRMSHSDHMTVVTQLLAAVGTLTAVALLLLMAAVPVLLDLPLERKDR